MWLFGKTKDKEDKRAAEARRQYEEVLNQLVRVRSELSGLREERDKTSEVNSLKREIANLEIQRDKLKEDAARKLREAEHKAGLLLTGQEQDIANARRETVIEVREGNLKADRDRFAEHMKFRDEHFQREIGRFDEIVQALMARLPTFDVSLDAPVAVTPAKARSRSAAAKPED